MPDAHRMPAVRAVHGAARVPGCTAPFDTVHFRVFHATAPTGDDVERLTGQLALDRSQQPWPVVVILPGINIGPEGYRWLAEVMVAQGYAVVTMAMIGESLPGQVGISPGIDIDAVRVGEFGTRPSATALGPLLDALAAMNSTGPLAGSLDLGRVVLAGHSGGGTVALQNADPVRFPGIVACWTYASHTLASAMLGWDDGTVLPMPAALPTLLLAGEHDGVMAASADRYRVEPNDPAHDPVGATFRSAVHADATGYFAVISGAVHTSLIHPPDPTTARGFLDPSPGRDSASIRDDISGIIVDFMNAHVRQDEAGRTSLLARLADPAVSCRGEVRDRAVREGEVIRP